MAVTSTNLMPLVMQLGRARAAVMNLHAVLNSTCSTVPGALGIAGAVMQLAEPADDRRFFASDAWAAWMGEVQYREGMGPLLTALRTGRVLVIDDLTRIGPPTVAATAAEYGLISSLALPIESDGVRAGALQLLGEAQRPVGAAHADVLRPLLEVLAARLLDVRDLRRAASGPTSGAAAAAAADRAAPRRVSDSGWVPSVPSSAPSPRKRATDSGAFETDTGAMPVVPTQRRHQQPGPTDPTSGNVGRTAT